jgi:hypothetical protein
MVDIPVYMWIVAISSQIGGFALTGKWSWHKVTVEGVGNILWGHDWGMLQPHIPVPPVVASPSIATCLVGSSTKYWLPSFSVREPMDGSAPGGDTPMAVSTPAFMVPTQNCQDISGWPFVLPSTISFQNVSTKNVGFTLADLGAGAIGMAGDSVTALTGRALGGSPSTGNIIAGALSGAAVNQIVGRLGTSGFESDALKALLGGAATLGLGGSGGRVLASASSPLISYGAGQASNAVASGPTYRRGIDGPLIDSRTGREIPEDS